MTQLEPTQKPPTIVDYIKRDDIIASAQRTLGARAQQHLTSIVTLASNTPALMECEPRSVYAACLTAAALSLSINPNIGQAYVLPYKNKGVMQAQLQIGYKGFVALALRTGKYKNLGAKEVREGQLGDFDNFTGEPTFDFNNHDSDLIIGYMAYFRLLDGFEKASYITKAEAEKHAKKYSKSYQKGYGPWTDDFNGMAKKTVLKLLLSKGAPLSTQMEEALVNDQKVAGEYADNKVGFEVENAAIEGELITEDDPIEAEAKEQSKYDDQVYQDEVPDVADIF